jgi:hypothetical protein
LTNWLTALCRLRIKLLFFGINEANYFKKSNGYFEDAFKIIENKYSKNVQDIIARSVPYATYIDLYNKSHIVLDQVLRMIRVTMP